MAFSSHIRRMVVLAVVLVGSALVQTSFAQETEANTRYAAAVALQNKGEYGLAADEWLAFIHKFPEEPRIGKAHHYLGVCYYQSGRPEQAARVFETVVAKFPKLDVIQTSYLYLGVSQYAMAQAGKTEMYDRALKTFDALIAGYPQGEHVADALYYRGECLYGQGKKAEAIEAYTQLVAKHRQHKLAADATYAVGVAQEEIGQMEAAGKVYEAFLARYPGHRLAPEVELRRAETLLATGQPAEAVKRFATAAARPGFALADLALLRQADALAQLKRYGQAAELYASLPAKFPQSQYLQRATLAGGKSYYLAGNYADARKLLDRVAASGGAGAFEAAHWIAQCLLKERRPEAALAAVEKILPQLGQTPLAPQLLMDQADAVYEIPGRRGESVALYAALASRHPQDPVAPQALYMAGFAALEGGDAAAALTHATSFLAAYRDHKLAPDVMHVAAEGNMQLGKFAEAASLYANLLHKHFEHPDAELWKVRRVVALFAQKRYAETVAALEPLLAGLNSPDTLAEAHYLIGSSRLELKQHEAAVKSLEASLAAQPKWRQADETLLALAQAYRQSGDPGKAKAALGRFLAEFPNSRFRDRAHYRLGECASLGGDYAAAAAEFGRVLANWPQSPLAPHAMHELGCAQLNRKDAAAAEATLTSLVDRFAQHALVPRARYARGMARHQLGRFAPAIEDLQAAISGLEGKERSDARFLIGLCQMELKQHAAAAATFSGLLNDDPSYSGADKAQYQWAWAMKLQGQDAEAVKRFRQLATAHPESPLAGEAQYNVAESEYANKEYDAAAKTYYVVLQKEDGTPLGEKAGHKLAWCYYHQENYANAQKTFAYQRQRYPNGPLAVDGRFMEAECLFKQGAFAEALKAYEALPALENKEFQALALLHAGQAAAGLKQWEQGLKHLARGLGQFPDSAVTPEMLYELGWVHQNLGRLKEAVDHYQQTIERADKVGRTNSEVAARAQFMIGEAQFQNKEHAEAVKSFFKVAYGYSYPKWQADASYEAARCFEVLGKKTQAAKMYQELIEKYPESDKVALAKQRLSELKP